MKNLARETIDCIADHGKTVDDVRWIGTRKEAIPIDAFLKDANRNYDDGYGGAEVNLCLLVVGDDWWLERHEYDGAEWWEFKTIPQKPPIAEKDDYSRTIFSDSFFW